MRIAIALSALLLFSGAKAVQAQEEPVYIANGTVLPISGPPIEKGIVVLENGRIKEVRGPGLVVIPDGADVVDATGKIVMPGLVDAYTNVGLVEIGMVDATRDLDEAVAPMTPHVHTADGLNVASSLYAVTRMNGTTSVLVAPAEGNLVPGRSCVIALRGDRVRWMVLQPHVALHVTLGSPPPRRYGERNQAPSTRMGSVAMLRAAVIKAWEYVASLERYEQKSKEPRDADDKEAEPPARDLELEAWVPVLEKKVPLLVRAQRVSDIEAAIRLADEFDVRVVLVRATEAWKMADRLAERKIPVLLGPVTQQPSSVETLGARYDAGAILHRAGVELAIISANAHNARNLPYEAGIAVAHGLPLEAALEAITLAPARILGLDGEIGSLRPGRSADVIVLDGDVIQPRTKVLRMWIRGAEVPLSSRQTELAERHRKLR